MVLGKQIPVETEKFANQSLDPVSFYRVSRFLCHRDAQALPPERVAAGNDCKELSVSSGPLFVYRSISTLFRDPVRVSERLCFHAVKSTLSRKIPGIEYFKRLNVFCPWPDGGLKRAFRFWWTCGQESHGFSFFWYLIYWSKSFSLLNP